MMRTIFTAVFLLLAVTLLPLTPKADESSDSQYRQGLMSIFQTHVRLIEHIVNGQTRYRNNLLRHAMALQKNGEFLDHGFLDETKKAPVDTEENTDTEPKSFYFYILDSQKARDNLVAVIRENRHNRSDTSQISLALKQVKESCDRCHQQFQAAE